MVLLNEDHVGVRAAHRFAEAYRAQGCPVGKDVDPETKENELWRRLTGMTVDHEKHMDAKERRAGIGRLVKWIEARVREWKEVRRTTDEVGRGGFVDGAMLVGPLTPDSLRSSRPSPSGGEGAGSGGESGVGSGGGDGGGGEGDEETPWACEGQSREMLERVCRELNITKWKLGELSREYRGIGARELIDGLMIRGVKTGIAGRLKTAARSLWGYPGDDVNRLICDERLTVHRMGNSEFFVDASENYYRGELAEQICERRHAVLKAFDALWQDGGMSRDGFAMSLGFRNFSELNRACLNVFGRSVRDLAWDLSYEIVEFYVAKELETLREIALIEPANERVARARYVYFRDAKKPETSAVNWVWDGLDRARRDALEGWLGVG